MAVKQRFYLFWILCGQSILINVVILYYMHTDLLSDKSVINEIVSVLVLFSFTSVYFKCIQIFFTSLCELRQMYLLTLPDLKDSLFIYIFGNSPCLGLWNGSWEDINSQGHSLVLCKPGALAISSVNSPFC